MTYRSRAERSAEPNVRKGKPHNIPDKDCGCETTIHIQNTGGTVNITTCSPPPGEQPLPEGPEVQPPGLPLTGACVPLAIGSKPKKSLQDKLRPLLENNRVPSVLPAAILQMARRFLLGRSAANTLELAAFDVFRSLPADLKSILACALQTFDALPQSQREHLFVSELLDIGNQAVEPERLAELVSRELLQRASIEVLGEPDCITQERPGLARFIEFGDDVGINFVGICRINGLRTNAFRPQLSLADYTVDEVQRQCTLEVVNDRPQLNCRVQTENCPGHQFEGTCLRVPEVAAGEAVILEGYNFFNIDARVRLTAKPPGTVTREVDAHVCGDETTPLTEIVDGVERVIADCRVQDRMTFQVPEDLPAGIYGITVVFANNSGNPGFGDVLVSDPPQFIQILPSVTATFQIASERLEAVSETSPAFFGSDEVAIRILAIPIARDLTLLDGEITEHNFSFGDVDSGESRDMSRIIFQRGDVGGIALSIIGFEVDDEETFRQQIDSFTEAYVQVLSSQWNLIATAVGGVGGVVAGALGVSYGWSLAIALAITLAIDLFVALWAPADLIIEDSAAFTALDLATRLSPNFPPPPVLESTSAGGIDVRVEPVSKDVQYIERRIYRSGSEDSEYQVTLRYNIF